jgi:hypothetical protein
MPLTLEPIRLTLDLGDRNLSVKGWCKLAAVFLWIARDLQVSGKETATVNGGHVEFSVEPEEAL